MAMPPKREDREVLQNIIDGLSPLSEESRAKVIRTVLTYFDLNLSISHPHESRPAASGKQHVQVAGEYRFGSNPQLSPKSFLLAKQPRTDVERVACLAYFLMHYRDQPHFKTVDISKLNTEAAQVKFSNAAAAVNNASAAGFLTTAGKGNKQLTAVGERFVDALPDRDQAKNAMEQLRTRRGKRRIVGKRQAHK